MLAGGSGAKTKTKRGHSLARTAGDLPETRAVKAQRSRRVATTFKGHGRGKALALGALGHFGQ